MTAPKHTPGVRYADGLNIMVRGTSGNLYRVGAVDEGTTGPLSREHARRDAMRFAAADELLAACLSARAAFDDEECRDCWGVCGDHDETCPAVILDAAIAKARGGA